VYVRNKDARHATVGFEREKARLDKDFVLYLRVGQEELGLNVLTHRVGDEAGYFLLMVSPSPVFESSKTAEKTVTFVVDTSGSMQGEPMERLRQAVSHGLSTLGPRDHFSIIRFSSDVERWRPGFLPANDDNIRAAQSFVGQMEAAGGTAIGEALVEATSASAPSIHYVVFVTDGRPTVGETNVEAIVKATSAANERQARIFCFGVGDDLNAHLLDKLAGGNGGTSMYVRADQEIEQGLKSFFDKVSYPVLADVQLRIDHAETYALLPGKLPDLFRGEQLLVVGRYRKPTDALVRIGGRLGLETAQFDYETRFPDKETANSFIASLWAERQVGTLLDEVRLRGETPALRQEIVQLATRYGIVTPYTSYLVVEPGMVLPQTGTQPLRVPRERPEMDGRPRDSFGGAGRGIGGGGIGQSDAGPPPASAPRGSSAPAPRAGDEQEHFQAVEELKSAEGSTGVAAAKKVAKMKGADRTSAGDGTTTRYVAGVTLEWNGSAWVDSRYRDGMRSIRLRYLSAGYFEVLREIPELAAVLSAGEEVVVVRGGIALVVGSGGAESLSAEELRSLR
jgi:Ca-activated chloride channel family protein